MRLSLEFKIESSQVWSPIREKRTVAYVGNRYIGSFGPSGCGVYAYVIGWDTAILYQSFEEWQFNCRYLEHSVDMVIQSWDHSIAIKVKPEDEMVIDVLCASANWNEKSKLFIVKNSDQPYLDFIAHNIAERPVMYGLPSTDDFRGNPQSPL